MSEEEEFVNLSLFCLGNESVSVECRFVLVLVAIFVNASIGGHSAAGDEVAGTRAFFVGLSLSEESEMNSLLLNSFLLLTPLEV